MAQKHQVILIDDVDGSEADETVIFALDGVEYEIDLTADHAEELREHFAAWIECARRTGGRSTRRRSRKQSAAPVETDTAEIRAWARENGYEVSDRGRISATIMEAYRTR